MNDQFFKTFDDIPVKEISPGFFAQLIHTDNNTINFIEILAGSTVVLHQHIHQQCSFVLEGSFSMTVGDTTKILEPGLFAIVPPNVVHGGTAVTDCKLIDLFSPVREEYKYI